MVLWICFMSFKHHSVASSIVKLQVPPLTLTMKMDQLPADTFHRCKICWFMHPTQYTCVRIPRFTDEGDRLAIIPIRKWEIVFMPHKQMEVKRIVWGFVSFCLTTNHSKWASPPALQRMKQWIRVIMCLVCSSGGCHMSLSTDKHTHNPAGKFSHAGFCVN